MIGRLVCYASLDPASPLEAAGDACLWGLRTLAGGKRYATVAGKRFIYAPEKLSCICDSVKMLAALALSLLAPIGLLLKACSVDSEWSKPAVYTGHDALSFQETFSDHRAALQEHVNKHPHYYFGWKRGYCLLFDKKWLDQDRSR